MGGRSSKRCRRPLGPTKETIHETASEQCNNSGVYNTVSCNSVFAEVVCELCPNVTDLGATHLRCCKLTHLQAPGWKEKWGWIGDTSAAKPSFSAQLHESRLQGQQPLLVAAQCQLDCLGSLAHVQFVS